MTIKTLAAAVALTLVPMMSFAECNWSKHEDLAMSCADGSVYDAQAGKCVPTTG
jgi:hypothetical protein